MVAYFYRLLNDSEVVVMKEIIEGLRCNGTKEYIVDKEIGYNLKDCFVDLCDMLKEWLVEYYDSKNLKSFTVWNICYIEIKKPKGKVAKIRLFADYSVMVNGVKREKRSSVIELPLDYLSEGLQSYIDCMFETLKKKFNNRISFISLSCKFKPNSIPVVDVHHIKDYIHIEMFECDENSKICRKLSDTHKDSPLLNSILCYSKTMVKALEDLYSIKGIVCLCYNRKSGSLIAECTTTKGYDFEAKWVLNEVPINIKNIINGITDECNTYFPNRTVERFSINILNNEVKVCL